MNYFTNWWIIGAIFEAKIMKNYWTFLSLQRLRWDFLLHLVWCHSNSSRTIDGKNNEQIKHKNVQEGKNLCDLWPSGSIPSWLQGTLLRNGPGLFSVGSSEYNHWFDGMSLIHSFTFTDGEIRSMFTNVISRHWSSCSIKDLLVEKSNSLMSQLKTQHLLPGVVSGEVTYRSKFLKSDTYKRNTQADRIVVSEFGTMIYPDPCKNIFSRYRPTEIENICFSLSRTCRDLV